MGNIAEAVVKDTGLSLVKETPKGILFRTATGVHMQVNNTKASLEVRIALPYRDETAHLLPMIMSSSTPIPAATFIDGHLLLIYTTDDDFGLIALAQKAENLGALLNSGVFAPDQDDHLKQLICPLNGLNTCEIDPDMLKNLARMLAVSSVVQTDSHPQCAAAYATQLPGHVTKLSVKPHALFFNTAGVVSLIEKTAAVPGCLILFDLRDMQDKKEHYLSIIHTLEMASMRSPGIGASYLICQDNSSITSEARLPMVYLSAKEDLSDGNRLRMYGVGQNPAELATFQCLKNATDYDTALKLIREQSKSRSQNDAASLSSLNCEENNNWQARPVSEDEAKLFAIIEKVFEQLTGHQKLKEEIIELVVMWALQKKRQPLVISLFGPSGCGKTFITRLLSEAVAKLFDMPRAINNIDSTEHTDCLYALIGSTVGLVGSSEQGILQKAASHMTPVLTFNEYDKVIKSGKPLLPDFLLKLLDYFEFTTGRGKTITFPSTSIFVFTGNGPEASKAKTYSMGFSNTEIVKVGASRTSFEEWFYNNVPAEMQRRIENHFFPEALSRAEAEELAKNKLIEKLTVEGLHTPSLKKLTSIATQLTTNYDQMTGFGNIDKAIKKYTYQLKRRKK